MSKKNQSKIKKPTKFSYGFMDWKIVWHSKLIDCKGCTYTQTQEIFVDDSFDLKTQRGVLFHEILHVIWYSDHLNPPMYEEYNLDADKHGYPFLEEYIVATHATGIMRAMHENPKTFKFIFGDMI
jgi:hypothetical protein